MSYDEKVILEDCGCGENIYVVNPDGTETLVARRGNSTQWVKSDEFKAWEPRVTHHRARVS